MKKPILKKLSDKHEYAAYLLTLGMSTKEVAIKVGVKPDTVRTWKKSKLFRQEMEKHYDERKEEAMDEFIRKIKEVQAEHLELCLGEGVPPTVRIKAIIEWEKRVGLKTDKDEKKSRRKKEIEKLLEQEEQKAVEEFLKDHPEIEEAAKKALIGIKDDTEN